METTARAAIRAHLVGGSAFTAVVSQRVYADIAPAGATMPYVVLSLNGGGYDNDTPLDSADVRMTVRGVSASAQEADTLGNAIRARLHKAAVSPGDGWSLMSLTEDTLFSYVEQTERVQYWHRGGVYRIRLSK